MLSWVYQWYTQFACWVAVQREASSATPVGFLCHPVSSFPGVFCYGPGRAETTVI